MRPPILLPALPAIVVLLPGCTPTGGPDLGPIGNGLKFIGVCVVVAMLVLVIGLKR